MTPSTGNEARVPLHPLVQKILDSAVVDPKYGPALPDGMLKRYAEALAKTRKDAPKDAKEVGRHLGALALTVSKKGAGTLCVQLLALAMIGGAKQPARGELSKEVVAKARAITEEVDTDPGAGRALRAPKPSSVSLRGKKSKR